MANSEDESRESFIRERVVGNKRSKKEVFLRLLFKFLAAVVLAAVFGAVAGAVFVKVSNTLSKDAGKDYEQGTLSIPRDEDTTTVASTEGQTEQKQEITTEEDAYMSFEEMIQNAINGKEVELDAEDYSDMYSAVSAEISKVNKAVVAISSKEERVDWFDNSIENDAVCAGIIWNITDTEILIGAVCDFSESTPSLEIEFCDGSYADAYVKGYDSATKLAVIAVSADNISDDTSEDIAAVKLGNSYVISAMEPIAIVGNPAGYIGSVLYGQISYKVDNMFIADMSQKGLLTDIYTHEGGNGFIVNYSGELLGIYGADCSGEFTKAYGISDLKGVLEKLSNGDSIGYLGVVGRAVTSDIAERYGLVQGVYVTETVTEEAAYSAGIKSGDIITAVDEEKIFTLYSLQNALEQKNAGDVVTIKVMRDGAEGYTEIIFDIELGAR